jgi:hypothetical protein
VCTAKAEKRNKKDKTRKIIENEHHEKEERKHLTLAKMMFSIKTRSSQKQVRVRWMPLARRKARLMTLNK